jgi:hypothetical protein
VHDSSFDLLAGYGVGSWRIKRIGLRWPLPGLGMDGVGRGVEVAQAPTESRAVAGWVWWELAEGEGVASQCLRTLLAATRRKK